MWHRSHHTLSTSTYKLTRALQNTTKNEIAKLKFVYFTIISLYILILTSHIEASTKVYDLWTRSNFKNYMTYVNFKFKWILNNPSILPYGGTYHVGVNYSMIYSSKRSWNYNIIGYINKNKFKLTNQIIIFV